jgi:hypothetical protein
MAIIIQKSTLPPGASLRRQTIRVAHAITAAAPKNNDVAIDFLKYNTNSSIEMPVRLELHYSFSREG